jgi:E3 ubiquitin-protein ligase MARCH5
MERADPLFLLIGLPMVPVSLILSKMIRWEDFVLRLWRKHCSKLPFLSYFFPSGKAKCISMLVRKSYMQL